MVRKRTRNVHFEPEFVNYHQVLAAQQIRGLEAPEADNPETPLNGPFIPSKLITRVRFPSPARHERPRIQGFSVWVSTQLLDDRSFSRQRVHLSNKAPSMLARRFCRFSMTQRRGPSTLDG